MAPQMNAAVPSPCRSMLFRNRSSATYIWPRPVKIWMVEYAVCDCGYDPDEFFGWFISSGVALRMVHLYEQKQNDLSKAQVNVVISLAKALGCEVEDLID